MEYKTQSLGSKSVENLHFNQWDFFVKSCKFLFNFLFKKSFVGSMPIKTSERTFEVKN